MTLLLRKPSTYYETLPLLVNEGSPTDIWINTGYLLANVKIAFYTSSSSSEGGFTQN